MTSTTSKTPKDVSKLAEQLDGTNNQQRAKGIADFVDGRIAVAVNGLREEVTEMVGRQKVNIAAAKDEGSPEAKESANDATGAVKAADESVKAADKSGSPEDVSKAADKVAKAKDKVDKIESDLARLVAKHEDELYAEDDGLRDRVKKLEDNQTGIIAKLDGLVVMVQAHAHAIANGGGTTTGLRKASRLAIATFVAVVAIWLLVVLVSSLTLGSWNIGIGLAAIAAGLVFALKTATMKDDPRAEAKADAGVDIVRSEQGTNAH